ncbi:CPBP family glutamic-type intramembrane protease [Paucibacter sp. O1-1]|nr:CPBP family glutamic-type intramembrane protease [Paucibacter sp. O1-1]MDA3829710.1 CPBP family glutamic-type intramembrane protease [Paucibacter sp. O1-1]
MVPTLQTSNDSSDDFPFYNGQPVALSPLAWGLLMLAVVAGFAALSLPLPAGPARLIPALLFPLIPLLALRALAGPHWRALFRRLGPRELALALGIALLNIAVTVAIGWVVSRWIGAHANPAVEALGRESGGARALFFLQSIPQLLSEELLTLLPLLALLSWFSGHLGLPRRRALLLAWLLSALPFALAHLPTYQWNLAQCLLVIGSARLVLSLAYLLSKNILVSTLAHVLNDWMLFGGAIVLSGLAVRG